MTFSAKTEYACLAMLELSQQFQGQQPVQVRRIADRHGIPTPFLVQILQELKRAGLVSSTRGASGGYRLSLSPEKICLSDVIDAVEGNSKTSTSAAGDSPLSPLLIAVCDELTAARREKLEAITLAELISRAVADDGSMWCI